VDIVSAAEGSPYIALEDTTEEFLKLVQVSAALAVDTVLDWTPYVGLYTSVDAGEIILEYTLADRSV
jgi:hypothetical protein